MDARRVSCSMGTRLMRQESRQTAFKARTCQHGCQGEFPRKYPRKFPRKILAQDSYLAIDYVPKSYFAKLAMTILLVGGKERCARLNASTHRIDR